MLAKLTFWTSLRSTVGAPLTIQWDKLFERYSADPGFEDQDQHPGWSPAVFDPCERGLKNVRSVSAMVLDYDGGETIEAAAKLWGCYYGFLHTTRKHTAEAHRFRVILPFSRQVSPEEYAGIWRRVFAQAGGKLDPAPKDPSRFWFLPGSVHPEWFVCRHLGSAPMDPDAVLREPDPDAVRFNAAVAALPRASNEPASAERRASAYLARMPQAISGSRGHDALWNATLAVAQGFGLSESAAFAVLWNEYNPRCQPPWSEKDIRHKLADAINRPKVPTGYKLDEGRDWHPTYHGTVANVAPHKPPSEPEYDPAEDWDRLEPVGSDAVAPHGAEPTLPSETGKSAAEVYKLRSINDLLVGVYGRLNTDKPSRGVSCGIPEIDERLGGFRRCRVTVLGAGTSWGKSSFAVMTTDVAIRAGQRVLLVSGEDSEDTYGQRIMSRRSGVNALKIRDFACDDSDKAKMINVIFKAESEPFFMNGIGKTAEYLASAIGVICAELNIDLVIVDYLQAFTCAKRCQDRRNEITHIARVFTDAIKGAGASGLIFSQLKRGDESARPTMHDLKESGDVENMAEHVLIGYAKVENGVKERFLLIEKNKDGPVLDDPIRMIFDQKTANFKVTEPSRTD